MSWRKESWLHSCVLIDPGSNAKKFWMVRQDGQDCIVAYGRLGTKGTVRKVSRANAGDLHWIKRDKGYKDMPVKDILNTYYGISQSSSIPVQIPPPPKQKRRKKPMKAIPTIEGAGFNW